MNTFKIDYHDAILFGAEQGAQDARKQARRDPRNWHSDFYESFVDTPSALAYQQSYYRAYDQTAKELLDEQNS